MKKILSFATLLLFFASMSWAYDFSAIAPSRQTLYFNITDSAALTVEVTCPGGSFTNAYTGYIMPTGNLVIPSTVSSNDITYTVTAIGEYAFFACDSIMDIEFPATVTTIESGAFSNCVGIYGMVVPSTVTTIEDGALNYIRNVTYHGTATGSPWGALGVNAYYEEPFTYADSTKTHLLGFDAYAPSAAIPATVTFIDSYAFSNCKELDSIVIPGAVTEFGSMIFFNSNVNKVILSEGVSIVPPEMFTACINLTEVSIPSTVTRIEEGAFLDCEVIANIAIPAAVTYIGEYAFALCYGLQTITLGPAVDSLYDGTFSMCTSLDEIISLNPVAPALVDEVFGMVPSTAVINIPCGSTESYDNAWGAFFTNFVEVSPVVTVLSDNDLLGYAELIVEPSCSHPHATIQATANEGYVFAHWSDGSTDNPYSFDVASDTTLIAYFASTQSIEDATDKAAFVIRTIGSRIVVEGLANETVRLFDCMGRCLQSLQSTEQCTFQVPAPGVYILQAGNLPAQRVVVVR